MEGKVVKQLPGGGAILQDNEGKLWRVTPEGQAKRKDQQQRWISDNLAIVSTKLTTAEAATLTGMAESKEISRYALTAAILRQYIHGQTVAMNQVTPKGSPGSVAQDATQAGLYSVTDT